MGATPRCIMLEKGGERMGYSVKWVVQNLGITRDMLRYYEKEDLLPIDETRNPTNKYRDYSDEDIERIWGIKLLIGIGFSAKEIRLLMNDPNYDFDIAITQKVSELEKKHDENVIYLEFAKSIKLLGRIPTASKVGHICFNDFLTYVHKNWNFYDDPRSAPFMKLSDAIIRKEPREWSPDDVERIYELIVNSDAESLIQAYTLNGYYQVIADMRELGYASDTVQRVVHLLHEYIVKHNIDPELDGKITNQFVAKYIAPTFLNGDIAKMHERNYGRDACLFIAKALAHYGGYDNVEEL